tara:strand:- start:289 stop:774 length:486 start_codon:yes stop_codon:yes gene_type:complete
MANSYAVDYKKRHVTLPAKLTEVATNGGRMRVLYDTYTVVAGDLEDQVVYFGRLPGGAKVWDASIYNSATLGSGTTIDLGWSAVDSTGSTDTDGFLDGVVGTGTTTTAFMRGGADTSTGNLNTISNAPVAVANEASVVATLIGGDPNAGVILQVMIMYSID